MFPSEFKWYTTISGHIWSVNGIFPEQKVDAPPFPPDKTFIFQLFEFPQERTSVNHQVRGKIRIRHFHHNRVSLCTFALKIQPCKNLVSHRLLL